MQQNLNALHEKILAHKERAKLKDEAAVQRLVRRVLNKAGVFEFVPPAGAYSVAGISDILAVKNGLFIAIECKYKYNKPSENQLVFGRNVQKAGGYFCIINERNVVDEMVALLIYAQTGKDIRDELQLARPV